MHFLTLFALVVFKGFVGAVDDVIGPDPAVSVDEQPHQRLTYYNWDHKDLSSSAFEDLPGGPISVPSDIVNQSLKCPDGWLRFSDSCYWIETKLLGFAAAERQCAEKQATLFVANSLDEWDAVASHAKEAYFSWIGLVRFTHFEKAEQLPRWQTTGSVNPAKINWLVRPFKPASNGWSSIANCAALYHSSLSLDSASYTFFYPCTYSYYSICERNSTILTAPL